jgi:dethiobiotin synthetase
MKPIAAGVDEALGVNADVAALAAAGNVDAPLADRNPYAFSEPIAPHIAARREGATIDLERVAQAYARLAARADVVVVEGAGGRSCRSVRASTCSTFRGGSRCRSCSSSACASAA